MPISGGKIYFKGTDISTLNDKQLKPYREKMQMVFQNPYSSFNPTMTIRQSFFEIGKVFGIGNEETEKTVDCFMHPASYLYCCMGWPDEVE